MNARNCLCLLLSLVLSQSASDAQVTVEREKGGYTVRSSEKFDVSPGGDLKMDDLMGDVTITGGAYSAAEIIQEYFFDAEDEQDARRLFDEYSAKIKKTGNRLEVSGEGLSAPDPLGKAHRLYIFALRRNADFGASYQVFLPSSFNVDVATTGGDVELSAIKGRVELETAGGDIDVTGVTGNVDGQTAGGDVTARDTDGQIFLTTAGGDISLTDARTGSYNLKTAGGDITMQGLKGDARASTSGGDVEARNVEGELDLHTSGGDITLEEVKGVDHRASTSGGDVEARGVTGNVDLRTSGGTVMASRVQGRVLGNTSGGDMDISDITGDADISTSGGDLYLRDIRGRLVGETSGGDIRARVERGGKLGGPIRLNTSGGEIDLRLPADVQASISARIRIEDSWDDYTVRSDFKLKITSDVEETGSRRGRRFEEIVATGDINGGGPLIELETVNGDIIITKGN
jgi:DUF4097 and DUF4098 domain-containing protein YvlB